MPDPQDRVSQLYAEALARTVTDRADFLCRACAGDEALRVEVESLLAHASDPPSILDAPLGSLAAAVLPAGGTSLLGLTVGSYQIVSALGAGGMGEVYRARDTKLGRDVALKILPRAFANDQDRLARFDREARVLASLNHPHIGAIYGLDAIDGTPALVLELIDGDTLAERIAKGPLPVASALTIATQMAEALEAAHERGIIHRDLKPANIKITPAGVVKVLDFGLAKAVAGDASSPDLTQSPTLTVGSTRDGTILGTAAYMSPEQARGQAVDRRTDIWAFGCVLYEMLTGTGAFESDSSHDTIARVLRDEPDWAKVPARARRLLKQCLEKDPQHRLRHVGDVMLLLDAAPAGPASGVVAPPLAPVKKNWRPAAIVAIVVIGVAALVMWASWRSPTAPREVVRFEVGSTEKMTLVTGGPTVSPDGHWNVFSAKSEDGVTRFWLRSLDTVEARPLPGTETDDLPPPAFWSWDSRYVVFAASNKLMKIDIQGGLPQTLADMPAYRGAAWNREGVIVVGAEDGPLLRVSASGGVAVAATALDKGDVVHRWPQFLPDGRHFLYQRVSLDPGKASIDANKTGIYVGSIDVKPDAQSLKRLLASDRQAYYAASATEGSGYLVFLRAATLMAQPFDPAALQLRGEPVAIAEGVDSYRPAMHGFFSVSDTGTLAYRGGATSNPVPTWFDQQGHPVGTLGEPGEYSVPAVSPDGTRVAVVLGPFTSRSRNIWLLDVARETTTRFTFDSAVDDDPVWSPDGKQIVFDSHRSGHADLYIKPADGSGEDRLLFTSGEDKYPSSWSKDGRYVVFTSVSPKTGTDLWALPMQGDANPIPLLQTPFNEMLARLSPDDRWIAYMSDESGRYEIYVRSFSPAAKAGATGPKWMVSNGGGNMPVWRPDGKVLFYSSTRLMTVDIDTSKGFQAGTPRPTFAVPLPSLTNGWDLTPDGKRFFFIAPAVVSPKDPFTVVLNWAAALKK